MPDTYERAVDALLDGIRIHLQQQHDRTPTDTAIVTYIRQTEMNREQW